MNLWDNEVKPIIELFIILMKMIIYHTDENDYFHKNLYYPDNHDNCDQMDLWDNDAKTHVDPTNRM